MLKIRVNVCFDADDFIFDTEKFTRECALTYFKEKYNMSIVNENGYNIKEMYNCTDEQQLEFWKTIFVKYSVFIKPRTNFVAMLEKLKSIPYLDIHFYICTAKYKALEPGVGNIIRTLFEFGLELNGIKQYMDEINYCSLENSPAEKRQFAIDRNISIFGEDNFKNIEQLKDVTKVICMTTKNNKDINLDGVDRANNFNQVYEFIMKEVSKITNKDNIYNNFKKLSREEREELQVKDLIKYALHYKEYIEELPFDKEKLRKSENFFKLMYYTYGKYFKMKYKPVILDKEKIPNEKGLIFVSNHQCSKDLLLILTALKTTPWHPLAKIELATGKNSFLMNGINSVFVDRNDPENRKESLIEMSKMLVNDAHMWIFPEGTYTSKLTTDLVSKFERNSHCYLGQLLGKTIVPVSLTQDYENKLRPIIRFLDPIVVNANSNLNQCNEKIYNSILSSVEKDKVLQLKL